MSSKLYSNGISALRSLLNDRLTFVLVACAFAIFSFFCVADCMRETDQASVLTGAWKIFSGSPLFGESYYNYDKLYETYWIAALGLWIRSLLGNGWPPVLVTNVASNIAFWATTLAAVAVLAKTPRRPALLALVCYLSTPALLINSVYLNPASISAGFLLLSAVLLSGTPASGRRPLGAFFFFVAVGARGDAVLLAPLLVWLQLPVRRWMRRSLTSSTTWLLAAAITASTVLGLKLSSGKPLYFDPGFLGAKVFAGYLVFGLGASLLLLLLFLIVLLDRALRSATVERALFYCAGAIALALPLGYYSLQLWSPRYLITTALAVFVFAVSRRGTALLSLKPLGPAVHVLRLSCAALAVVLLFVGIRLPSPARPRLSVGQPTLFPTADGFHPMGAYAPFLLRLRHVARQEIDHNQLAWKAAQQASYAADTDGFVHILDTPMRSYMELGATLHGLPFKIEPVAGSYDLHGQLYADSRSFMRLGSDQVDSLLTRLLVRPAKIVSPIYEGIAILHFVPDGDPSWGLRTKVLNDLFMGNEYRLYNPAASVQHALDGRPFAFVAGRPFEIALNGRPAIARLDSRSGFYYLRGGDTRQLANARESSDDSAQLTLAVQVLPAWMSVRNR
jgi:hypothetical protein